MRLIDLLREVAVSGASDLYLIPGSIPCMNCEGEFRAPASSDNRKITSAQVEDFAQRVMSQEQWADFQKNPEANLAFMAKGVGRFRVNVLRQRGAIAMVFRRVIMRIPTLRALGLPPVLRNISLSPRGIVLISGATGCGKSTTMASMLDYRNHVATGHIITIEDPIEYVFQHHRSIISQREVGIDTASFEEALKNSMRQAPQVISIGELRDLETVKFALHAAETGHLIFATLHSANAPLAVERLLHFFPGEMAEQLYLQLSLNLRAVVCQRLIPRIGGGRACAVEILVNTPRVQDLLAKGEIASLRDAIGADNEDGMQNFDKTIYKLHKRGEITMDDALRAASSGNDLKLRLQGIGGESKASWDDMSDPWANVNDDYAPVDINAPITAKPSARPVHLHGGDYTNLAQPTGDADAAPGDGPRYQSAPTGDSSTTTDGAIAASSAPRSGPVVASDDIATGASDLVDAFPAATPADERAPHSVAKRYDHILNAVVEQHEAAEDAARRAAEQQKQEQPPQIP